MLVSTLIATTPLPQLANTKTLHSEQQLTRYRQFQQSCDKSKCSATGDTTSQTRTSYCFNFRYPWSQTNTGIHIMSLKARRAYKFKQDLYIIRIITFCVVRQWILLVAATDGTARPFSNNRISDTPLVLQALVIICGCRAKPTNCY